MSAIGTNSGTKMQEELCKLMSSRFEGVNLMEITPFIAAMRMIKIEYGDDKPEVYKMLIAVLHDYNPFLGKSQYEKTVKYVKILLDKQPELCDYMVSIVPKPEDVQNPRRSQVAEQNVSFSSAGELLRHSLHIIGGKKKGFDLNLPGKESIRQNTKVDDPKMKIFKFYNFTGASGGSTKEAHSMAKKKWTIQAAATTAASPSVVVKTEPVDSWDSNTNSETQAKSRKLTVHDLIRERLQARQKQSVHQVVSDVVSSHSKNIAAQIKKEPIEVSVQRGETTTTFDSTRNRPIILRKPDLQAHHTVKSLPTAEIENKQKSAGNQSFPYTQQVIFSDGRKQSFVFNTKTKEDAAKMSQTKTVMVPVSSSSFLCLNSDLTNPLLCLQQMVSETGAATPLSSPTSANVVVVRGKKSPDTNDCHVDVVTIDESTEQQASNPEAGKQKKDNTASGSKDSSKIRKPRRNSSDPIDLTVDRNDIKRKRKRSSNEK